MAVGAFFDIDGTLYRNSLMIEHFKKLVKYEVVDPRLWHSHVKYTYKEWRKRVRDYEDYMLELVDIYIEALRGRKKEDLEFISNQVIRLNGDVVYKFTRDQIKWHQEQGHKVFFISGSPNFLVSKMAEKYGVDAYKGAQYLVDEEGRFTGDVIPMWDSVSKNKALKQLVEKYDLDLSKSYAYGDTNGDYSMLSKVGNPIAINPTRELLENIKANDKMAQNARIIVERKDVIYNLTPNVELIEY
ncbi:MAG: HAD-IB family hydrolase [Tissierellales bacterium]|jgi:HAD superfamily hydrolase (TIGR01490 family)|nr:HAD-IB family hydrolase [Tissierellales bacterium]